MSRPLKQTFNCEPLEELTRQLLFAPPGKRALQVRRAERLHDELSPNQTYPLDFIIYRLTGYRRDAGDSTLLVGEAAQPDLRLMIDRLSKSIELPLEEDETVETMPELTERLNVSTQTINRWRRRGLRWRWAMVDGRGGALSKQVVFPRAAVEQFARQHPQRVKRASSFSQIKPELRRQILQRARRIAERHDVTLNRVAQHLARRTGRALETIRLLLEKHDREHPKAAIFANRTGPLTPRQKRVVERAYQRGIHVDRIATRFGRSRATIYRVVRERRAARARRVQLDYVPSRTFEREDADAVILREEAAPKKARWSTVATDDLPEALQALYRQPVLEGARERSLFVRYNYLKYKAAKIRDALDPYEPRVTDLDAFDACLLKARALRSELARANLPVVLSVARRHLLGQAQGAGPSLWELLERGHEVLYEALETFSPARAPNFASYLTNKLLQCFAAESGHDGHARRRLSPEELATRLLEQARAHGVDLR